jgi:hypothetical protein
MTRGDANTVDLVKNEAIGGFRAATATAAQKTPGD